MIDSGHTEAASNRANGLFVLAVFGLNFAFMPLLVLLLPRRVETLFEAASTTMLSWLLLVGAVTASVANIAAGHIGDLWIRRFGDRRGLIGVGLAILVSSYIPLALAGDFSALLLAVVAFQIGLNLTFSPTMALLADHYENASKGGIAGWIGAALPLSAVGTTVLGFLFPADDNAAFAATAVIVALCVAPLVIFWGLGSLSPKVMAHSDASGQAHAAPLHTLVLLWAARAFVQLSASFVIFYLFLNVGNLIATRAQWQAQSATQFIATISFVGAAVAIPAALFAGYTSDRLGSRQGLMVLSAFVLAASLFGFANQPPVILYGLCYAVFQLGLAAYLSVDTALVAQLIGHHPRRGTILGAMNLTNTLPAILAPILTLQMAGARSTVPDFDLIYSLCAMCVSISAIFVLMARRAGS